MKWMLDTDTCIAIIKMHPAALKKLRGKSIGQVGISSITLLRTGASAERSSRMLKKNSDGVMLILAQAPVTRQ